MAAGSTYTPIATTTLGSDTSSISFTSISGSYTDLVLILFARSTRPTTDDTLVMRFNNDSGSNYSKTRLVGTGSAASSYTSGSTTAFLLDAISGASNPTGEFSPNIYNIMNYSNTTTYKTIVTRSNTASAYVVAETGLWRSTAAVNRIDLSLNTGPNFKAGTMATLYGIQAA